MVPGRLPLSNVDQQTTSTIGHLPGLTCAVRVCSVQGMRKPTPTVRTAIVRGADSLEQVQVYLSGNYQAVNLTRNSDTTDDLMVIIGVDVAGWTLDDYVIPRLASGLILAEEVIA